MKRKPLPYKRGDQVVYMRLDQYGLRVTLGEVTAVRNDIGVVYVKAEFQYPGSFRTSFGRTPGHFQENPYPLWMLRPLKGANFEALRKRATQASKLYEEYRKAEAEMQYEVECQAREWKWKEIDRRRKEIPHGSDYLNRVAARMGFKRPRKSKGVS